MSKLAINSSEISAIGSTPFFSNLARATCAAYLGKLSLDMLAAEKLADVMPTLLQ